MQQTELKPSYMRLVFPEQESRVEYRVLSADGTHYYHNQMQNGRAKHCYHENGTICPSRQFHPGVPCIHMERANQLEAAHRAHAKAEKAMQESLQLQAQPEELAEITRQEVAICEAVYQQVMSSPILHETGTPEYWHAAKIREQQAKKAYRVQRKKSLQKIKEAASQMAMVAS